MIFQVDDSRPCPGAPHLAWLGHDLASSNLALRDPDLVLRGPDIASRVLYLALRLPDMALRLPNLVLRWPDLAFRLPDLVLRLPDLVLRLPHLVLRLSELVLRLPDLVLRLADLMLRLPHLVFRLPDLALGLADPCFDYIRSNFARALSTTRLAHPRRRADYRTNPPVGAKKRARVWRALLRITSFSAWVWDLFRSQSFWDASLRTPA